MGEDRLVPGTAKRDRMSIFNAVAAAPDGLTCEEAEDQLGLLHQTASARICEMVREGRLDWGGTVRINRSGRTARVYYLPNTRPEDA